MNFEPTRTPRANLERYAVQAKALVLAFRLSRPGALRVIRRHHPRLPGRPDTNDRTGIQADQVRRAGFTIADARCVIARTHQFATWMDFKQHLRALGNKSSSVAHFEAAADAVVAGQFAAVKRLLSNHPALVHARSTREHRATLLHYSGANAVEGYRQKTPTNAVQIAALLLKAGAEVDADLDYGTKRKTHPERTGSTTLALVATSCHPAAAGVQLPLLDLLLEHGASVNGLPGGWNPLIAALHNGRGTAAAHLAERGAALDLEGAAGVGRLDVVKRFYAKDGSLKAGATQAQMEMGMMWACQYGHARVVEFLLENGFDVAAQPHGETGLHWAAYAGHARIVTLFLRRKASVHTTDTRFGGTPLGWALYGWCDPPPESNRRDYYKVVARLIAAGATVPEKWLDESRRGIPMLKKIFADKRMVSALGGKRRLPFQQAQT